MGWAAEVLSCAAGECGVPARHSSVPAAAASPSGQVRCICIWGSTHCSIYQQTCLRASVITPSIGLHVFGRPSFGSSCAPVFSFTSQCHPAWLPDVLPQLNRYCPSQALEPGQRACKPIFSGRCSPCPPLIMAVRSRSCSYVSSWSLV